MLAIVLILVAVCCLLYLFRSSFEFTAYLVRGLVGGVWLFVRLAWHLVRWALRMVFKVIGPALGRALEHLCVGIGLAWLWLRYHATRLYVDRELKARKG